MGLLDESKPLHAGTETDRRGKEMIQIVLAVILLSIGHFCWKKVSEIQLKKLKLPKPDY